MKRKTMNLFVILLTFGVLCACGKNKYQPKGDYGTLSNTTGILSGSVKTYDDGESYSIEAIFSWSDLTSEAINGGGVLVYADLGDGWTALPYSSHGATYSETINVSLQPGYVRLIVDGWDAYGSPSSDYLNGLPIKVVLISKGQLAAHPEVDVLDYAQVAEAFAL